MPRRPFSFLVLPVFLCALFVMMPNARAADAPAAPESGEGHSHLHNIIQGPHVEGHIAFLHAELGITPAQESLWAPVAAAIREDVKTMQGAEDRMEDQSNMNAVQYLENRVAYAKLRAEGEVRFLDAFRPLYDNLSDTQKRAADELLMSRAAD